MALSVAQQGLVHSVSFNSQLHSSCNGIRNISCQPLTIAKQRGGCSAGLASGEGSVADWKKGFLQGKGCGAWAKVAASCRGSLHPAGPCMSMPTGAGWSARAIKSFSMAELEARKLKYPSTGTEALLMGILTEGTSTAARFLRANGITLSAVKEETLKLLGKSDMYFFSPEHPPITETAERSLAEAATMRTIDGSSSEVTTEHMLLAIWAQKGSAGEKVLAALGFDDSKATELRSWISAAPTGARK